jgi:hypothetical protein
MEQSTPLDADCSSDSQGIPHLWWNPKVHDHDRVSFQTQFKNIPPIYTLVSEMMSSFQVLERINYISKLSFFSTLQN